MKIKFIKDYEAISVGMFNGAKYAEVKSQTFHKDAVIEVGDAFQELVQWVIDNGFAEEVKEWWEPKGGKEYYYINDECAIARSIWRGAYSDLRRYSMGNCFKTADATERYREYLKANATVRQDEGVLTPKQIRDVIVNRYRWVFIIINDMARCRKYVADARLIRPGDVCFDTKEHAQASLDKHPDEWKTIANYDWSRE